LNYDLVFNKDLLENILSKAKLKKILMEIPRCTRNDKLWIFIRYKINAELLSIDDRSVANVGQ